MANKRTKDKTTTGSSQAKNGNVKSGKMVSQKAGADATATTYSDVSAANPRSSERRALNAQGEKMRTDPTYVLEVARRAGIVDRNGQLTAYYKKKA